MAIVRIIRFGSFDRSQTFHACGVTDKVAIRVGRICVGNHNVCAEMITGKKFDAADRAAR